MADAPRGQRTKRSDPTGTLPLQRQFVRDLDARWQRLRKMIPDAVIAKTHGVNAIGHAAVTGDDPIRAFNSWLNEAMRQLVLGATGAWTLRYMRQAGDAGLLRANTLAHGDDAAPPADRIPRLQTMCVTELQGICDAVSQQAVRAFGNGILNKQSQTSIARDIQRVITDIGIRRGHLLVSFMTVRAFSISTLDGFRANGISHVGTVAERVRPLITPADGLTRDAKKKKKKWADPEDLVEVLTAGDDDVCPECEDISDEGPYTLDEAEGLIPAHPNCRCALIPADDARYASVHDEYDPDEPRDDHGMWSGLGGAAIKSYSPPQHGWANVEGQNHDIDEPPLPNLKPGYSFTDKTTGKQVNVAGERLSSGVIMREPDGRTWLVKPTNGFGGYNYTFPKGGVEEGLHPQANAIKETWEETGLKARITGWAGDYKGDTSTTRMYYAERDGGHPKDKGWETEQVALAHPDDLSHMLNRSRDKQIAGDHIPGSKSVNDVAGQVLYRGGGSGKNPLGTYLTTDKEFASGYGPVTAHMVASTAKIFDLDHPGAHKVWGKGWFDGEPTAGDKIDLFAHAGGSGDDALRPEIHANIKKAGFHGIALSHGMGAGHTRVFMYPGNTKLVTKDDYDPDEPRDDHGMWTAGGGLAASAASLDKKVAAFKVEKGITGNGTNEIAYYHGNYGPPELKGAHVLEVDNTHEIDTINTAAKHGIALEEQPQHSGSTFKTFTMGHAVVGPHETSGFPATPLEQFGHIDMQDLTKESGKKGSNEGGVYFSGKYSDDPNGQRYYIKQPATPDHVTNELVAAKLYQLAGVHTLNYVPVKGGAHVATEMEDLAKNNVSQLDLTERDAAKSDFAVHAWLANWDAAGTGGDNIGVRKNGEVVTLDTGGSLKYRAQGEPKGAAFGDKVTETNTLRDPSKNPDAAKLYGDMTNEQMVASMKRVTNLTHAQIWKTVTDNGGGMDLAAKMVARQDDLKNQIDSMVAKQELNATPPVTPKTILGPNTTPHPQPPAKLPEPVFKTKMEHLKHLMLKGTTANEVKATMGWPSVSMPDNAAKLGLKLTKTKVNGVLHYKGEPLSPQEAAAAKAAAPKTVLGPNTNVKPSTVTVALTKAKADQEKAKAAYQAGLTVSKPVKPSHTAFQKDLNAASVFNNISPHETKEGSIQISSSTDNKQTMAKVAASHPQWSLMKGSVATYEAPLSAFSDRPTTPLLKTEPASGKIGSAVEGKTLATVIKNNGAPSVQHFSAESKAPGYQDTHAYAVTGGDKEYTAMKDLLKKSGYEFEEYKAEGKDRQYLGVKVPISYDATKSAPTYDINTPHGNFMQSLHEQGIPFTTKVLSSGKHVVNVESTYHNPAAEIAKYHPKADNGGSGGSYFFHGTEPLASAPQSKPGFVAAPSAPPAPALTPPTDAELAKAKKNVPLQLQYVQGAPDVPQAHALIAEFNKKYAGKTLAEHELPGKVADFKQLQANMVPLQSAQQQEVAAAQAKTAATAQQKAQAAAQAAEAKKAADKAALEAKLSDPKIKAQYDKLHSIGVSSSHDLEKAYSFQIKALASTGHHITGADAAYISAYTGSAYDDLNESLWKGDKMNLKQSIYASALEKSLSKMPSYEGTAERGVKTPGAFARYAENVGHVVTERGFSSYGATHKLWGKEATIHLVAKDLKDIRTFNNHEGGGELILPRGAMIHITKVNAKTREVWAEQIA